MCQGKDVPDPPEVPNPKEEKGKRGRGRVSWGEGVPGPGHTNIVFQEGTINCTLPLGQRSIVGRGSARFSCRASVLGVVLFRILSFFFFLIFFLTIPLFNLILLLGKSWPR